jgi:hypothetical protein
MTLIQQFDRFEIRSRPIKTCQKSCPTCTGWTDFKPMIICTSELDCLGLIKFLRKGTTSAVAPWRNKLTLYGVWGLISTVLPSGVWMKNWITPFLNSSLEKRKEFTLYYEDSIAWMDASDHK